MLCYATLQETIGTRKAEAEKEQQRKERLEKDVSTQRVQLNARQAEHSIFE
jgi:hypothetical protein